MLSIVLLAFKFESTVCELFTALKGCGEADSKMEGWEESKRREKGCPCGRYVGLGRVDVGGLCESVG